MTNHFTLTATTLFSLLLASCSSILKHSTTPPSHSQTPVSKQKQVEQKLATKIKVETNEEKLALKRSSQLKIIQNHQVKKWINYFQFQGAKRFQRALNRGFFYQPIVASALKEGGLPEELFFLPLIESSYVSHARSSARAVGIWQFMKGTGKLYGLKVNQHLDERKNAIQASQAAVKYLKDLYTVFGSWELALAAYNCGEHRVLRAIMKGDSRNYWILSQKKLLPKETRNYVPKFMAAVIIGQNPKDFGLKDPLHLDLENHPKQVALNVPGSVALNRVSKVLDVPLKMLKKLNPQLHKGYTPPGRGRYKIWVPRGSTLSSKQFARLRKGQRKRTKKSKYHRVRWGETLSHIARRYGKSVPILKKLNSMTSSRIYAGQRLAILSRASRSYRVRKGDNLSRIAGRFGVSIAHIKQKNSLRNSRIYIGQKLKL